MVKWGLCAVLLFKETDIYFANDEDESKSGCNHSVVHSGLVACPWLTKGFLWWVMQITLTWALQKPQLNCFQPAV